MPKLSFLGLNVLSPLLNAHSWYTASPELREMQKKSWENEKNVKREETQLLVKTPAVLRL